MNPAQMAAAQQIRAALPPDLAAMWDGAHLSEVLTQPDPGTPEADPDEGDIFPDELTERGYELTLRDHQRGYNLAHADAIAAAAAACDMKVPYALARDCAQIVWRAQGGRWWTRTYSEWAAQIGISERRASACFDVLLALRVVQVKTGRCNVTSYKLDPHALTRLTYAYLAEKTDLRAIGGQFVEKVQTVEQGRKMFHGLSVFDGQFVGNRQTLRGVNPSSNPSKPPAPAREPVDNSPPQGGGKKKEPEPPTGDPDEWERAADTLARAAGRMNLGGIAEIREWAGRLKPSMAEALAAIQVVETTETPVSDASYFKGVIAGRRKRGEVPGSAQPQGMAANPALAEINRINATWQQPAESAPGARDALAMLRAKGFKRRSDAI